jgi:hypothetical protein
LSLGLFTFSLISFAREVKVAMSQTEFGSGWSCAEDFGKVPIQCNLRLCKWPTKI